LFFPLDLRDAAITVIFLGLRLSGSVAAAHEIQAKCYLNALSADAALLMVPTFTYLLVNLQYS